MSDAKPAPPGVKKTGFWTIVLYATSMNFSIRWLATGAATGPVAIPIWIAAAVLFMVPLVIATLELSSRFPEDGAIYAWTRETQGNFAGFLCGWLYWASNIPYFASLLFFVINLLGQALIALPATAAIGTLMIHPMGAFGASTVLIIIIAFMHTRGLGVGSWLPVVGAAISIGLLFFVIITGFYLAHRDGSATHFATANYVPALDANGAILWSTMVFAYGGLEGVALMRNEVKGGVKAIIAALVCVGVLQTLAYSIGTGAMLMIVPQDLASRLGGLPQALQVATTKIHASPVYPVVLLLMAVTLLGGVSAWFGAAARLPFAVGVDRMLPAALGRRDPKTGAPTTAIWLQTAFVVAIMALSAAGSTLAGAYDFVVQMGVLTFVIPYLWMFAAYWIVQKRPASGLDWQTPGGPKAARWITILGFIVIISAILGSLVPSPDAKDPVGAFLKLMIASLVMIAVGAAIYGVHWVRTRKAAHG